MLMYDVALMRHSTTRRPGDTEYRHNLGDLLRRARVKRGLSQAGLADLVGSSKSSIIRYEGGENAPPVDLLLRIAAELRLTHEAVLSPPQRSRVVGADLDPYLQPDAGVETSWAQDQRPTLLPHPTDDDPHTSPGSSPTPLSHPRRRRDDRG